MREPLGELRPYLVQILHPHGTVEGTGFLCHPDGFVLTCWHVMESWGQLNRIRGKVRFGSQELEAEWLIDKSDQAADLAVLKLTLSDGQKTPYLPLDIHWDVQITHQLETFGYPEGQFGQQGIATAPKLDGLTPTPVNEITVYPLVGLNLDKINHGYSGAPVVNRTTQKVIGLVHAKQHKTQAFLIPLKPLFTKWPELGTLHDVFEQIRQRLGDHAQARLDERLRGAPFIPPNLELGTIPKPEDSQTKPETKTDSQAYAHGRGWEVCSLKQLLPPRRSFVLSSDVGTGKSIFLDWLAVEIASKTRAVPIVLPCDTFERRNPHTINDMIRIAVEQLVGDFSSPDLEAFITDTAQKDELVFLFDGLDQIGSGKPSVLVTRVLSTVGRHPVLITSRPSAVLAFEDHAKLDFLRLQPFSTKDQRSYFGAHYPQAQALCTTAPDLTRVPMLAYMVRELVVLESSNEDLTRTELYDRFINHILSGHEPNRPITFDSPDLTHEVQHELQRLAYTTLAADTPSIQKVPISAYPKDARVKLVELPTFGLLNRIVDRGEQALFFTHQSFQEFLAAKYAADHPECVDKILTERWNPKWTEILRFLAGLQGVPFVKRILSEPDNIIHSNLSLAAYCIRETKTLGGNLKRLLVDKLIAVHETEPFQGNVQTALHAVREWGWSEKEQIAWLAGRLRDTRGIMRTAATSAFFHLGNHMDPATRAAIVERLYDEQRDARLCAVIVLGQQGDQLDAAAVAALVDRLRDKDWEVRLVASRALGRLGDRLDDTMLAPLVDWLRNEDKQVREGAVMGLRQLKKQLDAGALAPLLNRLLDEKEDVRRDTIWALGKLQNHLDATAVTALVGRLLDEKEEVRKAAILALQQLGDRLDVTMLAPLVDWLRDKDRDVHRYAIEALSQLGVCLDVEVLTVLMDRMRDGKVEVRLAAVWALRGMVDHLDTEALVPHFDLWESQDWWRGNARAMERGQREGHQPIVAVTALVGWLHDKDKEVRKETVLALTQLKDQLDATAVAALVDQLGDEEWEVRKAVVEALGQLRDGLDTGSVAALRDRLWDQYWDVRLTAVKALGQLKDGLDATAITALVDWLNNEHWHVCRAAVETLSQLGDRLDAKTVTALVDRLGDREPEVRFAAVKALGQLKDRLDTTTIATLVSGLNNKYPQVRRAIVMVLGKLEGRLDATAVAALVERLHDENDMVREDTVEVLGHMGHRLNAEAVITIIEWMHSRSPHLVEDIDPLHALRQLGPSLDTTVGPALVGPLQDERWKVRLGAATVLSQMGDRLDAATVVALKDRLWDQYWDVRLVAAEALSQPRDRLDAETIATLVDWLNNEQWQVRQAAVKALSQLGDRLDATTITILVDRLQDESSHVRVAAVQALGQLGDRLDAAAVTSLVRRQFDEDYWVHKAAITAVKALGQLGNRLDASALSVLADGLHHKELLVRHTAVETIGQLGDCLDAPVIAVFVDWLRDENKEVRLAAIRVLGQLRERLNAEVFKAFLDRLCEDKEGQVRSDVAKALTQLVDWLKTRGQLIECFDMAVVTKLTKFLGNTNSGREVYDFLNYLYRSGITLPTITQSTADSNR